MKYSNIHKGIFIKRPNRFIAHVLVNGKEEICHVKNTGRCRELLIEGVVVYVQSHNNPKRRTKFSLISVVKNGKLINMDSQAPNKVVGEFLRTSDSFNNITLIKPEKTYKNSRLDFYIEADNRKAFIEVKGVTLENDGITMFPDAPTIRGLKHIYEIIDAVENGYDGYIMFIIQMKDVKRFTPNYITHSDLGDALVLAEKKGVKVLAYECFVAPDEIKITKPVPIALENPNI